MKRLPVWVVYFITDGEYTKIGYTSDINTRLGVLQVGNPRELKVTYLLPCTDKEEAKYIEARYHKMNAHKHIRGEWYEL